jgi:hypothetical protein
MTQTSELADVKKEPTNYPIVVKSHNGHYFAVCPVLGVVAEGERVDDVYLAARSQIDEVVARYGRAGLALPAPDANTPTFSVNPTREVSIFALKTAIAGVVAAGVLILVSLPVTGALREVIGFTRTAGYKLQASIEQKLKPESISQSIRNLAATLQQITPERRAELRESLRAIAIELQPYASEIHPLFTAPDGDQGADGVHKSQVPPSAP